MDKAAHLLEYSLLGLLTGRAIRFTVGEAAPRGLAVLLAIALGAFVGLCDELYQARVPGRMCDVYDWLTDLTAVSTAVILTQVIKIQRRDQKPDGPPPQS